MKVKVRKIVRTPKRVEVTLIKNPRLVVKPADYEELLPTDLYLEETAEDITADIIPEEEIEPEISYGELYDEVEDMFDDAISDAMEDAARYSDLDDEEENSEPIEEHIDEEVFDETDESEIEVSVEDECEENSSCEDDEPCEDSVSDEGDSSSAVFNITESVTSLDTDGNGEPDTGVYCRYFDRDNQGAMVEVNQSNASGREYVCIDENSGKLSRICGIIKNEPDNDEDSIF